MIRSHLDKTPRIGKNVYVDEQSTIIGDVVIGSDSSIWPSAVIRGDMHSIRIGEKTSIQDGAVCHITHAGPYNPDGFPLKIGSLVTVGHQAMLHGCTLGDRCLIGIQSVVLDGAVIESQVMLAAGSLVPPGKVLESGFLYVGSPAIKKRALTQEEIEFIDYAAMNYVKLKDSYLK